MSEENKEDLRVTQSQLEIWLADPVSIALVTALAHTAKRSTDSISHSINSKNNDETCNIVHSLMGMGEAYARASRLEAFMVEAGAIKDGA